VIAAFECLGKNMAKEWARRDCDDNAFADVATKELSQSNILETVSSEEIVSWLMKPPHDVEQNISDVGQPPVRLYTGDGFYIEALFWVDGTTAIHEHPFTGAFGVLCGSSVQSKYAFVPERVVSQRLVVGRTRFLMSEVLIKGSVRAIHSGNRLIHSVCHLDRASVTIHAHTSSGSSRPQYVYWKPYLAVDEIGLPSISVIQTRMLESLARTNVLSFWKAAREMSGESDSLMLFRLLSIAFRLRKKDNENWSDLLSVIPSRSRWLLDYCLPCLEEKERNAKIGSLIAGIADPNQRLFLALLLNVPTREELWKLISELFPDQTPEGLILSWAGEIFKEQRLGIKLNAPMVLVLGQLLKDSDYERSKPILYKALRSEGQADEETIRKVWLRLRSLDIFKPLFGSAARN
jgi:hypothetical protein